MSAPGSPLVDCWECDATGIVAAAAANTSGQDVVCHRCHGTKKCPEVMREWMALGAQMRKERQARDLGLGTRARELGISVVTLSFMECGMVAPTSSPSSHE